MEGRPIILALDRNRRNLELLTHFLQREGYRVLTASTLEECDQVLAQNPTIALALVGLAGFGRQIWTRCDTLDRASIPFLVIAPPEAAAVRQASLHRGARGLLVKPVAIRELRALIRHLVET